MRMSDIKTINVDLGARSYDILIGGGLLENAAAHLKSAVSGKKLAIITDENVAKLHLSTLQNALLSSGFQVDTIILPAGESTKSFTQLEYVLGELLSKTYSRKDTLIALGGGVIGDLTGFAAAVLKRGCGFVQIPTTLLAQVDSSVGGKTAINTAAGKNLVGSFYQPSLVLADTDVLKTLPPRQMKAGYAEIIKYGLIDRPDFFDWLESNGKAVLAKDPGALTHAIAISCAAKAAIVKEDEHENGKRALLNLGHTFGHALEGKAGYSNLLLHGEAISAGLVMAFEFSNAQGLSPAQDTHRLRAHLAALDMPLPETLPEELLSDAGELFSYMMQDKKNADEDLNLILARGIGQAFIAKAADKTAVKTYLQDMCKA